MRPGAVRRPTGIPWWGLVSAAAAPVLLVGGWTWAAALQPGGFDPVRETISALAGLGATRRGIMTAALVGVGLCHLTTSAALRTAPRAGRAALGLGGLATLGVAAAPLPADGGSAAHTAFATTAFVALAVWPALPPRRDRAPRAPFPLRRPVRLAAAGLLLGLVGWFGLELFGAGDRLGLAERAAAGAQAVWPLVVVLGCRLAAPRAAVTAATAAAPPAAGPGRRGRTSGPGPGPSQDPRTGP
ncbi:DUF998 domain-containing protein [Kineosporia sp. A_224]|uniref:DUF998 domain-containing protein n=1 Tax=Kineosporia sp. A_224 TaxID=1962180 RepID=UPI00117B6441|nr:DUF998 domain-containing protein [Kineosporia sp. A_224]